MPIFVQHETILVIQVSGHYSKRCGSWFTHLHLHDSSPYHHFFMPNLRVSRNTLCFVTLRILTLC